MADSRLQVLSITSVDSLFTVLSCGSIGAVKLVGYAAIG